MVCDTVPHNLCPNGYVLIKKRTRIVPETKEGGNEVQQRDASQCEG